VTSPLFHVDEVPADGEVRVTGAEGRHAVSVKRLTLGERVLVSDGRGRVADGEVTSVVGRDELVVRICEVREYPERTPRLTVIQALAKGDRADLAVELMTEIGVDEIIPWAASRSIAQWKSDKADRGLDKWRSTARESAKQSRRARVPIVSDLMSTGQVAAAIRASVAESGLVLVLHEDARESLVGQARSVGSAGSISEITLVVGPEGGIAPAELDEFTDAGAVAVRLGSEVMRTSTAGGAAAAVISALIGRW
jgi:16S rRNA (uracil1498-N3)-methyltransferase